MVILQEISGYFLIGFILTAGLFIVYLPVYFILRKKIPAARQAAGFLFAACIVIILFATVFTGITIVPYKDRSLNIIPFKVLMETWKMGVIKQIAQTLANIVMFMPLGFIFPVVFTNARKLYKTAIYMASFSFLIEFVQYFTGRQADIDDIMLNTLGGITGYLLFLTAMKLFKDKKFWKKLTGLYNYK